MDRINDEKNFGVFINCIFFLKREWIEKKNILKDIVVLRKYFVFDCEYYSFRFKGVVFMLLFKEVSFFFRMFKVEGESYVGKK